MSVQGIDKPSVRGGEPAVARPSRRADRASRHGPDGDVEENCGASGVLWKGGLALLDQSLVSATNFATSVVIGRVCTADELGAYSLGFSVLVIAMGVQGSLIAAPYAVFIHRLDRRGRAAYSGSTLIHHLALTGLAVLLSAATGFGIWLGAGAGGAAALAWTLAVMLPFILAREFVRRVLFAHLQLWAVLALDALAAMLQLGCLLLLAYVGQLTVTRAFLVMGLASVLAAAAGYGLKTTPFRLKVGEWGADWRRNWRFGRWVFASQIVSLLHAYSIPWLLALLLGVSATATIAVCSAIAMLANPFVLGVSNFLGPKMAQTVGHSPALLRPLVWKTVFLATGVLGAFCIALLLAGEQLVAWVYGAKYGGNGMIVFIEGVGVLVFAVAMVAENALRALDRPSVSFYSNVIGLAATILGALLLVGPYGVLGAALGGLAGKFASAALRLAILKRFLASAPACAANPL